jgi:hypothetical protein
MKRIKKSLGAVISIVLAIAMMCTTCAFADESNPDNTPKSTLSVNWVQYYDSLDELEKESDIVVDGHVVSYKTELRYDVVFTRVLFEVEQTISGNCVSGDIIEILQTGGQFEDKYTPYPEEFPALQPDREYRMYLYKSDYSDLYGQYYLVTGGYQGVFTIDSQCFYAPCNKNKSWSMNIEAGNLLLRSPGTPALTAKWYLDTIYVHYQSNISTLTSIYVYNSIVSGMQSWNTYTDCPTLSITTNAALANAYVLMQNYGETGWDAQTYREYDSNSISYSHVQFNTYYNNSYHAAGTTDIWASISCHEFGHLLGLEHHSNVALSIMRVGGTQYIYNPNGSPQWVTPQYDDIIAINYKY